MRTDLRALRKRRRVQRNTAIGVISALVVSGLAVGFGVQSALAASPAPKVTVAQKSTPYVAGEDLVLDVKLESAATTPQYNLSVGVVLPADVTILDPGAMSPFAKPKKFAAGTTVPAPAGTDCTVVGLPADCKVPAGQQYLVFENISDLPQGASNAGTLRLRPKAGTFPVGSTIDMTATAFTSDVERFVPSFPGVKSASDAGHTSSPGKVSSKIKVEAVRIAKAEPSKENQLLRGVHDNATTYTLRVEHTGEGDVTGTEVVDFLPAGLEYLGAGGVDNSTHANGTRPDGLEYDGAPSLTGTPAPAGSGPNAGGVEKSVTTVIPTAAEVEKYGLEAGKVYTKVVWDLGTLLAAGSGSDVKKPIAQVYAGTKGEPGAIEIRYRAGVPLFENTLDFDGAGNQPTANNGRGQIANLDNNRGASTRQGNSLPSADGSAKTLRNTAGVTGTYTGAKAPGATGATGGTASHTVEAVDVRLHKTVDDGSFTQGKLGTYTLDIATSEYTSAKLGDNAANPANRLLDDLSNGLCPAIPAGHAVSGGPRLMIGDPRSGQIQQDNLTPAQWNAALGDHANTCAYPSTTAGAKLDGATLRGLAFDPVTGHFFLDLKIDALPAGTGSGPDGGTDGHRVVYTAAQNAVYANDNGATSSGDLVSNTASLDLTTTPTDATKNATSAGDPTHGVAGDLVGDEFRVTDDSAAQLRADLSSFAKSVLPRGTQLPGGDIRAVPANAWQSGTAAEPFTAGDTVWWRIQVTPPRGADVRNPQLTDFLPPGTAFDDTKTNGRYNDIVYKAAKESPLDTCAPTGQAWYDTFIPNDAVRYADGAITWKLGSSTCVANDSNDRFFPSNTSLDIFIKVKIVDVAAFGAVDISANLAKYQQQNVSGEVFFLRDEASIRFDTGVRLVKGVAKVDATTIKDTFNGNGDNASAVQASRVQYRLDVTAPGARTSGYTVYDALPVGAKVADLDGYDAATHRVGSATASTYDGTTATSSSAFTALAYDWADVPADIKSTISSTYANRSIIVWTYSGAVPGSTLSTPATDDQPAVAGVDRGFTLGYALSVPDGIPGGGAPAQVGQQYQNVASVVSFDVQNNDGVSSSTIIPTLDAGKSQATNGGRDGSSVPVAKRPVRDGEFTTSADSATDPAMVRVPAVTLTKKLISTEVGPETPDANGTVGLNNLGDSSNTQNRVVQGEYATYEYTAKIPAHTSVAGATLSDGGSLGNGVSYQFVKADFFGPANAGVTPSTCGTGDLAGFTCEQTVGAKHGVITFPSVYDNFTDQAETYRVRITVWVKDRDANPANAGEPNIANNQTLTNTATFAHTDANQPSKTVTVTANATSAFVEPAVSLEKKASTKVVGANGTVGYTLTAKNAVNRPGLFDNVIYDCVPEGMIVEPITFVGPGTVEVAPGQCSITAEGAIARGAGTGTLITWKLPRLMGGESFVLPYTARVVDHAGGGTTFKNVAELTGYTLPDVLPGAKDRRGTYLAKADETVGISLASVKKTVSPASAPVGADVQYTVRTALPANVNFYDVNLRDMLPMGLSNPRDYTIAFSGFDTDPAISAEPAVDGLYLDWPGPSNPNVDIARADHDRTITVTFTATVATSVTSPRPDNTATFSWNKVNDAPATRTTASDHVTVELLNPNVRIDKKVDGQSAVQRDPGATLTYTLNVTNNGNTAAHNIVAVDTVPAGIKVDTAKVQPAGATFSNEDDLRAGRGGTITWRLNGPLAPVGTSGQTTSLALSYPATLVDSTTLHDAQLTNTVRITSYDSFATNGWTYRPGGTRPGGATVPDATANASVTPVFPQVALRKDVATPAAGKSYGVAHIGEAFGWKLTLRNDGKGSAQTLEVSDVLPKHWTYAPGTATLTVNGAAVTVGDPQVTTTGGVQTLRWKLGSADAPQPVLPGTVAAPDASARTAVLSFSATPQPEAATDAGVGIEVKPHTNTLGATATDTQGNTHNADVSSYAGKDATAVAYLGSADLAIAKTAVPDPIAAGSTGAKAWTITVSNAGADLAEGPITVTDKTVALPTGVRISGVSGAGWVCSDVVARDPQSGQASFTCVRSNPADSLAKGASFPPITVTVDVDANQAVVTEPINNTAIVKPGRTFDPNTDNNSATDGITIKNVADLAITKKVATAKPTAGASLSWTITPENIGPSTSHSGSTSAITITDKIPAGISGVVDASTPEWRAAASNGWPAKAGDTITWTYTGARLAVGVASPITLSGTIDAAWTGGKISNTAVIAPGETEDPKESNNSSKVDVQPGDETTLGVSKTRVVANPDGTWRDATAQDVFKAGADISYRVVVVNNGPADARKVQVVDTVPTGLTYRSVVGVSGDWARTAGPGANDTFRLDGTLRVGAAEARSFVATYRTDPSLTGTVHNVVEASAENATNKPTDSDDTGSSRRANLAIEKSHTAPAAGEAVVAGTTATYRLVVKNTGPSISDAPVRVADTLPTGFSYADGSARVSIAGGAVSAVEPKIAGGVLTWDDLTAGAVLPVGATVTITFDVRVASTVPAQRGVENVAEVFGPNDDDPTDNVAKDPIDITTRADLSIAKTVQDGPWIAGTDVTYTLRVANRGPSVADSTRVVDVLPQGLEMVSMTGSGTAWTCDAPKGGTTGTCDFDGRFPIGESTITVRAHIAAGVAEQTKLTNTATVTWTDARTYPDPKDDPRTDTDDATITVDRRTDLWITKQIRASGAADAAWIDADDADHAGRATAGETTQYRVTVGNDGPSDAIAPLRVTDVLPKGATFVELRGADGWTADTSVAGTVTFTRSAALGGITAGSKPLSFEYVVHFDASIATGAVLTNTATLDAETLQKNHDTNPDNNADPANVVMERAVDLAIVKRHNAGSVRIGSELPFELTVTNHGPSDASSVTVTDTVPAGLDVVSAAGDAAGDGWTITDVAPVDAQDAKRGTRVVATWTGVLGTTPDTNTAPVLEIRTRVTAAAYRTIDNVASVTAAEITDEHPDRNPEDNTATDTVIVPALATLVVEKTAVGGFQVGKTGNYRITVRNDGPTVDPGPITVTDVLPAGLSFAGAPGSEPVVDGKRVTWTIQQGLAVGEQMEFTLQVNVERGAYPKVTNVVTVTTPTEQTPDARLSDDATVTVKAADPLAITGAELVPGIVGLAALLLVGGGAIMLIRRRRREIV